MATAAKKKIVVCGGNGFLGMLHGQLLPQCFFYSVGFVMQMDVNKRCSQPVQLGRMENSKRVAFCSCAH